LRNNFFETIGYNDIHTSGPRTHPEPTAECQRFRAHLRNLNFINPVETRIIYKNLGEEYELSDQLKNFSYIAKKKRQEYITEVFYKKNKPPLFKSIPVTKEEWIAQNKEENLLKKEILFKIEVLLEQMNGNIQKKYHAIKSKNRDELLIILQEVTYLFNTDNELNNHDDLGHPEITQQEF
jgi:hypothetical protein